MAATLADAAAVLAAIPPELCGVGGCCFTPHHPLIRHSWEPVDDGDDVRAGGSWD